MRLFYGCGSLKQETAVVSMMFILLPQIWQTSLCKPLSREHGTHMVGWCQLLRKGSQFPSVFTETLGKSWLQSSGRCWPLLLRRRERIQILPGWGPATALECSKSSRHCTSSHWSRMWNISRLWLFKKSVSPDALTFSNWFQRKIVFWVFLPVLQKFTPIFLYLWACVSHVSERWKKETAVSILQLVSHLFCLSFSLNSNELFEKGLKINQNKTIGLFPTLHDSFAFSPEALSVIACQPAIAVS